MSLQRYERLQLLGRGTMGAVYAARDRLSGKRVAVKVLHPQFGADSETAARFAREARALKTITHPNVTKLIDVIDGGACPAYVMELLEGQTLRTLLEHEPMPPLELVYAIAMQLAAALEAVHGVGVVHRYVKPENVFCNRGADGVLNVKLIDFGIAKVPSLAPPSDTTGAGTMLGTPEYMAPEQVRGEPTDARADVYAFGAMLYEMLCGRPPIAAKNIGELVIRLMAVTPEVPSACSTRSIGPELDALVMACLAKHPCDRPRSMAAVRRELHGLADAMNGPTAIMHVDEIDAIINRGRTRRAHAAPPPVVMWNEEARVTG